MKSVATTDTHYLLYQATGAQLSCQLVDRADVDVAITTHGPGASIREAPSPSVAPFALAAGAEVVCIASHGLLVAVATCSSLALYMVSDAAFTVLWTMVRSSIVHADPGQAEDLLRFPITCLAFHAEDGLLVGAAGGQQLALFSVYRELSSGDSTIPSLPRRLWTAGLEGLAPASSLMFSPDGRDFAVLPAPRSEAGAGRTPSNATRHASVWSLQVPETVDSSRHDLSAGATFACTAILPHPGTVSLASWDPSSQMLCTLCIDGVSRFWLRRLGYAFVSALNPLDLFARVDPAIPASLVLQPLHWLPLGVEELIQCLSLQERNMYALHEYPCLLYSITRTGAVILLGMSPFHPDRPYSTISLKAIMKIDKMLEGSRHVMETVASRGSPSRTVVNVFLESSASERHSTTIHALDLLDFFQVSRKPKLTQVYKCKPITEPITRIVANRTGPHVACFSRTSILFEVMDFTNLAYHSTVDLPGAGADIGGAAATKGAATSTSSPSMSSDALLSGLWLGRSGVFVAWTRDTLLFCAQDVATGKFSLSLTLPLPPAIFAAYDTSPFHIEYMGCGPNVHVVVAVGPTTISVWHILAPECMVKYAATTELAELLPSDHRSWIAQARGRVLISGSVALVQGWEGVMDRMLCLMLGHRAIFLVMDVSFTWSLVGILVTAAPLPAEGHGSQASTTSSAQALDVMHVRTNAFGALALGTRGGELIVNPLSFYKHDPAAHTLDPVTPRSRRTMGMPIVSLEWTYTLVFGNILGVHLQDNRLFVLNESLEACYCVSATPTWTAGLVAGDSVSWSWGQQGILVRARETNIDAISITSNVEARSLLDRKLPEFHPLCLLFCLLRRAGKDEEVVRLLRSNLAFAGAMVAHHCRVSEFPLQLGPAHTASSATGIHILDNEPGHPPGDPLSSMDDFLAELEGVTGPDAPSPEEVEALVQHPFFDAHRRESRALLQFVCRGRDAALDDRAHVFALLYHLYQSTEQPAMVAEAPAAAAGSLAHTIPGACLYWPYTSETQEPLLQSIFPDKQAITWEALRSTGAGFWIRSLDLLKTYVDLVARSEYLKTSNEVSKHPIHATLFYVVVQKRSVLLGLWKLANHPEQPAMVKFLASDFTRPEVKSQALKNAFVLLSKQRYMYAAAFFLLGGSFKDCLNVLLQHTKELQLAWVVSHDSEEHVMWARDVLLPLLDPGAASSVVLASHLRLPLPLPSLEVAKVTLFQGTEQGRPIATSSALLWAPAVRSLIMCESLPPAERSRSLEHMIYVYRKLGLPALALECLEELPRVPACCMKSSSSSSSSASKQQQEAGSSALGKAVAEAVSIDWGEPVASGGAAAFDWGEPVAAVTGGGHAASTIDWGEPVAAAMVGESHTAATIDWGEPVAATTATGGMNWGEPVQSTKTPISDVDLDVPAPVAQAVVTQQPSLQVVRAIASLKWDLLLSTFPELMSTLTIYQKHPFLALALPDVAAYLGELATRISIPLGMVYQLFALACAENHGILAYTLVVPPEADIMAWKSALDNLVLQECNFLVGCVMTALQEVRAAPPPVPAPVIRGPVAGIGTANQQGTVTSPVPPPPPPPPAMGVYETMFRHSKRMIMALLHCQNRVMLTTPSRREVAILHFVVLVHLVACLLRGRYDIATLLLDHAAEGTLWSLFAERILPRERYLTPEDVEAFGADERDHDEDGNPLDAPTPDSVTRATKTLHFLSVQFFLSQAAGDGQGWKSHSNEWLDRVLWAVGQLAYAGFRRPWLRAAQMQPLTMRRSLPAHPAKALFEFLRKRQPLSRPVSSLGGEAADVSLLLNGVAVPRGSASAGTGVGDEDVPEEEEDVAQEGIILSSRSTLCDFVIDPLNRAVIAVGCVRWVKELEIQCPRPLPQFPLTQEETVAQEARRHNIGMDVMDHLLSRNVKHFNEALLRRDDSVKSLASSQDSSVGGGAAGDTVSVPLVRTASISSSSRSRAGVSSGTPGDGASSSATTSGPSGLGGATCLAPLAGTHTYLTGTSAHGNVELLAFGNPVPLFTLHTPLQQVMVLSANPASGRFLCTDGKGTGALHLYSLQGSPLQTIPLSNSSYAGPMAMMMGGGGGGVGNTGFGGGVYDAIFTSPSMLAVCGLSPSHTNVALYDTLLPAPMARVMAFTCLENGATCITTTPGSMRPWELVVGGRRGEISVLDTRMSRSVVCTLEAHEAAVKDLLIGPDGTLYSASKVIKSWTRSPNPGGAVYTPHKHYYPSDPFNYVYRLALQDEGYMVYLNASNVVRMRI